MGSILVVPELDGIEGSKEAAALNYVIMAFNKVNLALNNEFLQDYEKELCPLLKEQIISNAIILLRGYAAPMLSGRLARIALVRLIYFDNIPDVFLRDLVAQCVSHNQDSLSEIFGPILSQQRYSMLFQNIAKNHDDYVHRLYRTILRLISIKTEGNIRPICDLLVSRPDFLPDSVTGLAGREIQKQSFLGPFFEYSVYCDEAGPLVVSKYFGETRISKEGIVMFNQGYRQRMNAIRMIGDHIGNIS
uniref:COP9 signalosome complex subunit 4 n=1 Tax=Heterorhabditis bacteriophora TaxID=37862 RepID=A0A1I7WV03_HETBA